MNIFKCSISLFKVKHQFNWNRSAFSTKNIHHHHRVTIDIIWNEASVALRKSFHHTNAKHFVYTFWINKFLLVYATLTFITSSRDKSHPRGSQLRHTVGSLPQLRLARLPHIELGRGRLQKLGQVLRQGVGQRWQLSHHSFLGRWANDYWSVRNMDVWTIRKTYFERFQSGHSEAMQRFVSSTHLVGVGNCSARRMKTLPKYS